MGQTLSDADRCEPLILRDPILAQCLMDALADISGVPLAVLRRHDTNTLFRRCASTSSEFAAIFPDSTAFAAFLANTSNDPFAAMSDINRDPCRWRAIAKKLSFELYQTRPSRVEPVLHLLRDHWCWSWVELFGLTHLITEMHAPESPADFYGHLARHLWSFSLVPVPRSGFVLALGPVKIRSGSLRDTRDKVRELIHKFGQQFESPYAPCYPSSRFEQFIDEPLPIDAAELEHVRSVLTEALKLLVAIEWPEVHEIDALDLVAAADFSLLLSDMMVTSPMALKKGIGETAVFSYRYPIQLAPRRAVRQISVECQSLDIQMADMKVLPIEQVDCSASAQITVDCTGSACAAATERDISAAYLDRLLSGVSRRRRGAQELRFHEDLLLLRYRLTDSAGMMLSPDRALSGDEIAKREEDTGRRIARTLAYLCNAEAVAVYRLDHGSGRLSPFGVFLQGGPTKLLRRQDLAWMEAAGDDPVARKQSVSYASTDQDAPVCYNESDEFEPIARTITTKLHPPHDTSLLPTKSILAVPIRVFGRLWGVLEVMSGRPNAFSHAHLQTLQEMADLIGPHFHDLLVMGALYRLAESVPNKQGQGYFDRIAKVVADVFLTDGACVWVKDLIANDRFECRGYIGRPDLERLVKEGKPLPIKIEPSMTAKVIRENKTWITGKLGVAPFAGEWMNKSYTQSLMGAGYKYIAEIPVCDAQHQALSEFSLYSTRGPFSASWEGWARYISSYMGVVIAGVHSVREVERNARLVMAHEINNSVTTLSMQARRLAGYVRGLPPSVGKPAGIDLWISDIATHARDAKERLEELGEEDFGEKTREISVISAAKARLAAGCVTRPIGFRHVLNQCIQGYGSERRTRNVELSLAQVDPKIGLLMFEEDLRTILTNLSANAVKYAVPGSTIVFGVKQERYSYRFFVKNLGAPLEVGEHERIFDMFFRGSRTKTLAKGSGLGLFLVKKIAELYNIVVTHEPPYPPRDGSDNVWHQFNLDAPRKVVVNIE